MSKLAIDLPLEIGNEEAKLLMTIKLFELGRLSLGQSAKLSGYSITAFMELLGKYNVPVFDYPAIDLVDEIEL